MESYLEHIHDLISGDALTVVLVVKLERQMQPIDGRTAREDLTEELELVEGDLAIAVAVSDAEQVFAFFVWHATHIHQFIVRYELFLVHVTKREVLQESEFRRTLRVIVNARSFFLAQMMMMTAMAVVAAAAASSHDADVELYWLAT